MQLWRVRLVGLLGLFLGGCVTTSSSAPSSFASPTDYVPLDRIQIANRFEVTEINAANIGVEAYRCVPQLSAGSKNVSDTGAKLPLPRGMVRSLSHLSSSSSFVISGSKAICIHQSATHYPIFAAAAFSDTVNPSSVPPTVTDGWYAQIARRMAEAGRVTVAYVFPNGNADIASYWVEGSNKNAIHYAREFKKAGTWETGSYDFRFSHSSLTSVTSTKRGQSQSMIKTNFIDYP
jgi:hypothetical protein